MPNKTGNQNESHPAPRPKPRNCIISNESGARRVKPVPVQSRATLDESLQQRNLKITSMMSLKIKTMKSLLIHVQTLDQLAMLADQLTIQKKKKRKMYR